MSDIDVLIAATVTYLDEASAAGVHYMDAGMFGQPGFAEWASRTFPEEPLSDADIVAVLASDHCETDPDPTGGPDISLILDLLTHAQLPGSVLNAVRVLDALGPARWLAELGLYESVDLRLKSGCPDRASAIALAHLVESAIAMDFRTLARADSTNGIPMSGAQDWWPRYIELIDEHITAEDLLALTMQTQSNGSDTEAFSSRTPPERLAAMLAAGNPAVANNARLSRSSIIAAIRNGQSCLFFHPNLELEEAWDLLLERLKEHEGELDPELRDWDNMRDDGWWNFSWFQVVAPNAPELRARIANWLRENVDDPEDLLEQYGLLDDEDELNDEDEEDGNR